jgi:hypothetical protein
MSLADHYQRPYCDQNRSRNAKEERRGRGWAAFTKREVDASRRFRPDDAGRQSHQRLVMPTASDEFSLPKPCLDGEYIAPLVGSPFSMGWMCLKNAEAGDLSEV